MCSSDPKRFTHVAHSHCQHQQVCLVNFEVKSGRSFLFPLTHAGRSWSVSAALMQKHSSSYSASPLIHQWPVRETFKSPSATASHEVSESESAERLFGFYHLQKSLRLTAVTTIKPSAPPNSCCFFYVPQRGGACEIHSTPKGTVDII